MNISSNSIKQNHLYINKGERNIYIVDVTVMMANALKFFSFLFFISILAPAASAELISVSMPSSGEAGNSVYVHAYYYDNESAFIPSATCTISEGFFGSSSASFYYDSGNSRYTHYLYLSSAGNYNFRITCSKAGYLEQSSTEYISISKGYSNLYLNSIPGKVDIGDSIYVEARYEHDSHIFEADCDLRANEPSGTTITKDMSEGASSYYYNYPLLDIGSYFFEVSCSSSKYSSASSTFYVVSSEKSTTLSHSAISSEYFPQDPITIHYYYKSGNEWITGASCTYNLKKGSVSVGTGTLKYTPQGYTLSLNNLQSSDTPYSVEVTCDVGLYSKAYNSASIYVREIQTMLDINVVTPEGRVSYAPINIDINYKDSKRYTVIDSPKCTISFANKEFTGTSIKTELPAADMYRIEKIDVCCEKENYQKKCQSASVDVSPQQMEIQQFFDVARFVAGNTYEFRVIAKPLSGSPENIVCDASATFSSQGQLLEKPLDMKKRDNEFYAMVSFDDSGQATITTSCKGAGYIKNIATKTIKVKMFEEKYESTLTKVLGAAGVVLLSALIIIRKKFKV